jgi:hypothetical protein
MVETVLCISDIYGKRGVLTRTELTTFIHDMQKIKNNEGSLILVVYSTSERLHISCNLRAKLSPFKYNYQEL